MCIAKNSTKTDFCVIIYWYLQIIGTALRGCVEKDPSLWVVCQALDSVFDMFGSDSCPPDLFTSLSLLPVLRQAAASFTARVSAQQPD